MSRSDYSYKVLDIPKGKFIAITDLNLGRMSVTNNIENVLEEIAGVESLSLLEYKIVYRDSEGTWDAWDQKQSRAVYLGETIILNVGLRVKPIGKRFSPNLL